jgi:hypothetical protein
MRKPLGCIPLAKNDITAVSGEHFEFGCFMLTSDAFWYDKNNYAVTLFNY